ncbi:aa3-type cytochrome oxidase subunit CtaJ [Mangrovihabitans endophyticus]|uniref:Uncharacterized protein n=1 Tax=Mangrovihabitans endophyticus TaxID=1751298 RepID=A0A8J3C3R8_9ACTN|nr:hypothetical protein [Mangrovihabitans endophyticus]GGL02807.1 hypothetical protein GCM10012284_41760 [Mangrovihabitans endophyticus]
MSVLSTVLVFVIIPVVAIAVVGSLVAAGTSSKVHSRRYRPGRPYDFRPIWFLAAPEQIGTTAGGPADNHAPVLEARSTEDSSGRRVLPGPVGGASDRW